jgi:hypothetical protein
LELVAAPTTVKRENGKLRITSYQSIKAGKLPHLPQHLKKSSSLTARGLEVKSEVHFNTITIPAG